MYAYWTRGSVLFPLVQSSLLTNPIANQVDDVLASVAWLETQMGVTAVHVVSSPLPFLSANEHMEVFGSGGL
jgi:hypothetical protein